MKLIKRYLGQWYVNKKKIRFFFSVIKSRNKHFSKHLKNSLLRGGCYNLNEWVALQSFALSLFNFAMYNVPWFNLKLQILSAWCKWVTYIRTFIISFGANVETISLQISESHHFIHTICENFTTKCVTLIA